MIKEEKKKIMVLGVATIILIVVVPIWFSYINKTPKTLTPQEQVIVIAKDGLDTSNSIMDENDTQEYVDEFNEIYEDIKSNGINDFEQVVQLGFKAKNVRDFYTALALYDIVDLLNPDDKFYLVDKGNIYIELQQWENARQVFEPMRVNFPVFQAYLGLAKAYQNIDETPDYIIDEIYEEAIYRHNGRFDLLEAYVNFLEKSGREEKALKYYEMMNQIAPQQILEDKINELKQKYPNIST